MSVCDLARDFAAYWDVAGYPMRNRIGRARLRRSILRWRFFDVIDHQHLDRRLLRLQLETELRLYGLCHDARGLRWRPPAGTSRFPDLLRHIGIDVQKVIELSREPRLIDYRDMNLARKEAREVAQRRA